MDLKEQGNNMVVHAELPGVKKEDINIDLTNGFLTISGEKKCHKKEDTDKYHRVERSFGKFSRSMTVPKEVTEDQIKATFNDGVLEVTWPKPMEKKQSAKKITVS